jgi:8-oxo-dGTP diphosphatase
MTTVEQYTIRVYGLLINPLREILLADEFWFGKRMTKFPGGGLIPGEGTIDCLRREFREELSVELINIRHFYTTDFYQPTELISPPRQLISVYYLVDTPDYDAIPVKQRPFDFDDQEGAMAFRWLHLSKLSPEELTFPIDKMVAGYPFCS